MKNGAANLGFVATTAALLLAGCGSDLSSDDVQCTTGQTYASIFTALGFARAVDQDVVPGFNVDGRLSLADDSLTCGKKDFVDPDGVPGIDNQLATLVPEVEKLVGNAVDGLVQGAINDGQLVILMEMENVDDLTNDQCVNLAVQVGVKKRPSLGTDGVIEAFQTFEPDPTAERSYAAKARIENGVLTTGPFNVAIPLAIFDVAFTVHVQDARLRFSIDEEGKIDGIMGGGVLPQEIVDGVGQGAGTDDIIPAIKLAMDANTDLHYNDDTGKCEQLSAALEFAATPAFIRR